DRFVLVPLNEDGSAGESIDATLSALLADVTVVPRTPGATNQQGTTSANGVTVGGGLNLSGFEVVATLGGEASGSNASGGSGALSDPALGDPGLVRENAIDFGNFRVVYQE